jgi:hypothetical protein
MPVEDPILMELAKLIDLEDLEFEDDGYEEDAGSWLWPTLPDMPLKVARKDRN